MSEFRKHCSTQLQAVFSKRPFQIQEPEKARIIFLGLDANFAEELDNNLLQEFIDYLKDGVGYWKAKGIHTPMLQPYYTGGGKRYHVRFKKLDLNPEYAQDICFLELLNICTCGNSTTPYGKARFMRFLNSPDNQRHLTRIAELANDRSKQFYICGRRTEELVRELGLFDINERNVFAGKHFSAAVTNKYLETSGRALKKFLTAGEYVPKDLEKQSIASGTRKQQNQQPEKQGISNAKKSRAKIQNHSNIQ